MPTGVFSLLVPLAPPGERASHVYLLVTVTLHSTTNHKIDRLDDFGKGLLARCNLNVLLGINDVWLVNQNTLSILAFYHFFHHLLVNLLPAILLV